MLFSIKSSIKGDRSVFGHSSEGSAGGGGKSYASEALSVADSLKSIHDWTYLTWNGDTMVLEFDSKNGSDQETQTLVLHPENYYEFSLLKKWEIDNDFFVQGSD